MIVILFFLDFRNGEYWCLKCNVQYPGKRSLKEHLAVFCNRPPRFQCPYCNVCMKQRSNVYKHIRRKHKGNNIYVIDLKVPNSE